MHVLKAGILVEAKLPISESTRKRNPHLFSAANSQLAGTERKQDPVPVLDPGKKTRARSKRGVVVCVTIIVLGNRFLDDDNVCAGCKSLRDEIAKTLGVDDGDKRVKWEYGFAQTAGPEQTLVRIALK